MPTFKYVSALFLLFILPACSSQAPPDYQGEALTMIKGHLQQGKDVEPGGIEGGIEVAIMWTYGVHVENEYKEHTVLSPVRIESALPAKFRMEVFQAPPPGTYLSASADGNGSEVGWALGNIVAIRAGTGPSIRDPRDPNILGFSLVNWVMYVPESASSDTLATAAETYKFPEESGFHLITSGIHPAFEKEFYEQRDMGFCVRQVWVDALAGQQEYEDAFFSRCQFHWPDAPVCTRYSAHDELLLTTEQSEADLACLKSIIAASVKLEESGLLKPVHGYWEYLPTEGDMDFPVTIDLGTTYWDWVLPTYFE